MRARRVYGAGLVYHVVNRGNNRQALFFDKEDYKKYLGLIYRFKQKLNFKLYAFCLMTNHVHLLIKVGSEYNVSHIMKCLTNAHTRHYHFKNKSSGHVWQGRFSSPIVSTDNYLMTVMKYIEQNPVRAKMVNRIEEYTWSSYKLNCGRKDSKLIDREDNPVFMSLGVDLKERIYNYKRKISENLCDKEIEGVKKSENSDIGYISDSFKGVIKQIVSRQGLGRPKSRLLTN